MTPPVGFIKAVDGRLEKAPDLRLEHTIPLVFRKTLELGSARQAALWLIDHDIDFPIQHYTGTRWETQWRTPTAPHVLRMLRNPMYAGTYVYGRRRVVTEIKDGVPRTYLRARPLQELLREKGRMRGAIPPRPLERIRQAAILQPSQPLRRDRRATGGAAQPLEAPRGPAPASRCSHASSGHPRARSVPLPGKTSDSRSVQSRMIGRPRRRGPVAIREVSEAA
jgi:hypothetical protein